MGRIWDQKVVNLPAVAGVISAACRGNLMKLTTKLKLLKIVGRVTGPPKGVAFTATDARPKKLLIFFPLQKERFMQSLHFLRQLERYPPRNNFHLAIRSDHRSMIPPSSHKTFYYPMSANHPERIDYQVLASKFGNHKFDAVINLEPEINLDLARVISQVKASKRIGFAGPGADDLYNIQIRRQSASEFAAAYDQILAFCDLGPESDHPDHHLWR